MIFILCNKGTEEYYNEYGFKLNSKVKLNNETITNLEKDYQAETSKIDG
jgi:hypothetical protein